jgi:hypothetical protein
MNKEAYDPLADFEKTTRSYVEQKKPVLSPSPKKVLDIRPEETKSAAKQSVKIPKPAGVKKAKVEVVEPVEAAESALINVTTRLPEEQRRILKQAASWNKAFGVEPQTEQGIIQLAIADYFEKSGFPKDSK